MNPALLILDPQNDFFGEDNPNLAAFQAAVSVINAASSHFHAQKWPLAFIQHTSRHKPVGSDIWEIYPGFERRPDDLVLNKTHYNAFWNTKLDSLLRSLQVDTVLVCGFVSEYCVLSTLRGAFERGYRGALLDGAIASLQDACTRFVLDISPHISLDQFKEGKLQ